MLDTPSTSDRCEIRQRSTPCPAAPVAVVVKRGSVHAHYFHVCAAHLEVYSPAAGWRRESPMAERQSIPVLVGEAVGQ